MNEGFFSIENQTQTELKTLSKTVTMETSEQSNKRNIPDYETEVQEMTLIENKDTSAEDEQVFKDNVLFESLSAKVADAILADLPPTVTNGDEFEDVPSPKEALVLDDTNGELNRNESVTSSVSDTPSSAESMYENEAMQKRQDSVKEELLKDIVPVIEDAEDVDILDPLKAEFHEDILDGLSCEVDEAMLESFIREEVMSDISNESGQNPEDLEECLLVEIAAASSDSETDEKWRTIFSSSINKEDDDSYLDSLQLSAQELFIQKPEVKPVENQPDAHEEAEQDVPMEATVLEQPESTPTYVQPTQEISYNPSTLFHGLSKISEDEEELGKGFVNCKDFSSTCTKSDSNKKMPKDYCVIQEMKSENVSTEHVDFRVARNQWLQIEEQTKNLTYQPVIRTGTCQGTHSFMYTPVRNIDRPKRDSELENLALGRDYQHTQFSPCSEDSGVDDSSFRSPYDDPETPVEKEMRSAMEKEEILRYDRGMSKSYSSDCVPGKGKPVILNPGKLCQEVDEKRKMLEHQEQDCGLSPSTQMPSFIITSSPTRSQKHEMTTNNVIILEPESCHQSPCHAGKMVTSKSADWGSDENASVIILETSNLIIRSASELNLNSASMVPEEKTFLNNPFFKLRSRSTLSLVDEEIKMVKQREEELKKQRASIYSKENFLASPNLLDSTYDQQGLCIFILRTLIYMNYNREILKDSWPCWQICITHVLHLEKCML